jgi:hypothetical protein
MFVIAMTIKVPGIKNTQVIVQEVKKIVYGNERKIVFKAKSRMRRGSISYFLFNFVYLIMFIISFGIIISILNYYNSAEIQSINHLTDGQACTCELGINNSTLNIESDKPILISACDNGVYYDTEAYNTLLLDKSIDIIVWTFLNEPTSKNNPNMYAWLEVDDNDFVKNVSCKKFDENKHNLKTSNVIIGTMFFRKGNYFIDGLTSNYKENIRSNNEFYVDDVLNQNIKAGLNVKVFNVDHYVCWGTPDDYETYCYWQHFFDKCNWHPYKINQDITSK